MTEQLARKDTPIPSGLDMRPTIEWYSAHQNDIIFGYPVSIHETSEFDIQEESHLHITNSEITALSQLFPVQARNRSRLNTGSIIGKPTLYFGKDATPTAITTTGDVNEAISPTAVIPSYIDNSRWQETGEVSGDIWLFQLPPIIPPKVRKIIHTQGFVHEYAHSIATQALYTEGYTLQLPTEITVDAYDYLVATFAAQAEKHPPVSHYSSFYRKEGEEFSSLLAIEEELVESITARLLGFAFSSREQQRFQPLADRPEVVETIDAFLHATLVTSETIK